MMIGSNAREDKCRVCGGDSSSCQTIDGIYDKDDLVVGLYFGVFIKLSLNFKQTREEMMLSWLIDSVY